MEIIIIPDTVVVTDREIGGLDSLDWRTQRQLLAILGEMIKDEDKPVFIP